MNSINSTILVVDDNDMSRYTTVKTVHRAGYKVLEASSGKAALEIINSEKPDLVLLDLQLPDINGYEVCKQIKTDPHTRHIIVIYLTSLYKNIEHKAQGLESGADAYLTHPVEPLELISTIQAMLRFQKHERIHEAEALQWIFLFNAVNDPVLLLDVEGKIVRYNQAFKKLVSKPDTEIMGEYCYKLVHTESGFPIDNCPLIKAKETLQRETLDLQIAQRWYEVRIDPIFSSEKALLGFAQVMTDITERKTLHKELERRVAERTDQLEEANQELKAFNHVVSHDLKAPVRRISDYLSLLDPTIRKNAEPQIQETLDYIEKNTHVMTEIIEGLYRLSHTDKVELSKEPISIGNIIQSVFDNLTSKEQKERIQFELDPLPDCYGDPILIRQVWQNLIGNAIKFTSHQTRPQIIVTGKQTEDAVEYCIRDNGIGFDMHYSDKLFTMFGKLNQGNGFEGQGIGLALCKKILAKHGGTIRAESKPGEGASFYISLPKPVGKDRGQS